MDLEISKELARLTEEWPDLHRSERRDLARALRRYGLSYGEIVSLIPASKSTVSNWCGDIALTPPQIDAIGDRVGPGSRMGIPVDTQWRRRREIETIRRVAREFARQQLNDATFVGGVVLYWGEGSKTKNYLDLTNADPLALRFFVHWVRRYLDAEATFVLSLHLHEGNHDSAAQEYWRQAVGLPEAEFTKTYIKPRGTGHRKNHLEHGVCRVRTRNASNHWHRVMTWIDVVSEHLGSISEVPC